MRTKKFGGLVPSLITPLPFNSSSRLLRSLETTALSGEISPGRTTPRNTTVWRSLFIATERSASITRDPLLSTATTRPARLVRKLDFDEACALPCRVAAECVENIAAWSLAFVCEFIASSRLLSEHHYHSCPYNLGLEQAFSFPDTHRYLISNSSTP